MKNDNNEFRFDEREYSFTELQKLISLDLLNLEIVL